MRHGRYKGSLPELHDLTALVRDDEKRGWVLAQFDKQRLPSLIPHETVKPGEGHDEQIPYCFGWHRFLESEFEFELTPGHGVDCRCLECLPEPHSLDQLRRRF